jgi:glyoxylase-like metal-dependent hydrolase (beta-lactamase superfamily II)
MKVQKVAEGVYMLQGAGGNIGVSVGEDGVLVIDDEFAPLAPKIKEAIKTVSDKPVRWILNTHWHGDHTGSNAEFAKTGTEIIAQDNVRKRLQTGMPERKREPAPKDALPIITFDNSLTVHVNGEDIRALHYASGHTDGDSIIFFPKANVVHMGDDFVTYGLPYVDSESGGSVLGMVENVEKAMAAVPDDVKIIPGHGDLSTKADVQKFTEMLRDCIALVKAGIKKGKTLDQMKNENVIAKYDAEGKGSVKPADFIEQIYNELKGKTTKQPNTKHH